MTRKALGLSHKSDDFQNEGILGSGGFAAVERVRNKKSRKFYARKVIAVRPPLTVDFCVQEINVMERLDHRHVIKLISSEILARRVELVLPLADEDLSTYMSQFQENRLPDDLHNLSRNLQKWIGCLSSGLTYLHEQSVRHKDIKPQNILLMGDRVMYTDFGVSRDFTDLQSAITSGDLRGTPMYCAPEVFNEQKRDTSADIFSLGCVYLEMLVCLSQHSFSDFLATRFEDNPARSYQAHLESSQTLIERLVEDNDEPSLYTALFLCKKMLEEKPLSRPSAIEITRRLCTKAGIGCEQCVGKPLAKFEDTLQITPSSSQDSSTSQVSSNRWTVNNLTRTQWQLGIAVVLLAFFIPLSFQFLYPANSFWTSKVAGVTNMNPTGSLGISNLDPPLVNYAVSATTKPIDNPESESTMAATTTTTNSQIDPPTTVSASTIRPTTRTPLKAKMIEWTSDRLIVFKRTLDSISDECNAVLGSDPRYLGQNILLQGTIDAAFEQITLAEELVASARTQIDVPDDGPGCSLLDEMINSLADDMAHLERTVDIAAEQLHAAAGIVASDYVKLYGTPKATSTSTTYRAPKKIFQATDPDPPTRPSKSMRLARRLLLDWLLALTTGLLFTCFGPLASSDAETLLGCRIIFGVYALASYLVWHSHAAGDFWVVAETWASKSAHNISTLLCGVGPLIWVSTYVYQGDDGGWGVLGLFCVLFVPATVVAGHGIVAILVGGGWRFLMF